LPFEQLSIFQTEYGLLATTLALLTWAFLNFLQTGGSAKLRPRQCFRFLSW
jgi:hypothetical protein